MINLQKEQQILMKIIEAFEFFQQCPDINFYVDIAWYQYDSAKFCEKTKLKLNEIKTLQEQIKESEIWRLANEGLNEK